MIKKTTTKKTTKPTVAVAAKPVAAPVAAPAPAPAVTPAKAPKAAPAKAAPAKAAPGVMFEIEQPGANSVFVAGSFNQWQPERTPLQRLSNGRWVGNLQVNPGRYEYLFVVDGQWMPDPKAGESVQNPYGGLNSVVQVSE
jgi:1,4-alpha-glucan branching enzyme